MTRRTQVWYRSKNAKLRRENLQRRSRLGVLARERKRLSNPAEREPKFIPFYPLQFKVRDRRNGLYRQRLKC